MVRRRPQSAYAIYALVLLGGASAPLSCRRAAPPPAAEALGPAPRAAGSSASPGAPSEHIGRFAVIGDFGQAGPGEASVAALVRSWQPEFVITTGDNNYPNGAAVTFEANIAQYFAPFIAFGPGYTGAYAAAGRAAHDNRFFPVLGNHDWRTSGATDYLSEFVLPGHGRYYTFERNHVAFFMVDSDKHEPDGVAADSGQARWLQAQLAASAATLKIVVFHHPPYSLGAHGSATWMRWPFRQWGASVVLTGHNHNYERHTVDGLPYVVNGIGGARLHTLTGVCAISGSDQSVCASDLYGAMRAEPQVLGGKPHLTFEAVAADGRIIDTFSLPM